MLTLAHALALALALTVSLTITLSHVIEIWILETGFMVMVFAAARAAVGFAAARAVVKRTTPAELNYEAQVERAEDQAWQRRFEPVRRAAAAA